MLFSDSYFTIKQTAEGIYKDKGSKFFAYAFPVSDESEIKERLVFLKKQHASANHHCYAWRLGADKSAFRANDDGEPANTAGKPILAQIQSNNLTNVLIVVVRYFGGTLLGVGGLISAYKNAAALALENASIEERFILFEYKVEFGFDDLSYMMKILKDHHAKIVSQNYDEQNEIVFQIKKLDSQKFEDQISALYKIKLCYIRTL